MSTNSTPTPTSISAALQGMVSQARPEYQLDPVTIISIGEIFVPMILQCLGITSGQSLHDVAMAHYDEETNDFEPAYLHHLRPRAKLAAIKAKRQGKITEIPNRQGLDEISRSMLMQAKYSDEQHLAACADEAFAMPAIE